MDEQEMIASIFADETDLKRYREAIASGATEDEALRVGDNGVGYKGDNTATMDDPIVALPPDMPGVEYNRLVQVTGPKGTVVARIADRAPRNGRIDLNPATAAAVGHNGGLMPVSWKFLDGKAPSRPNASFRELGARPEIPDLNIGDMPDMAPNALSGIDMLTAIDPSESSYQGTDLLGGIPDLGNQDQTQPQSPEEQTGSIKMLKIPAPNLKNLTKVSESPDGKAIKLTDGSGASYTWYPKARGGDGHVEKEESGSKLIWANPGSQAEVVTPKAAPKTRTQLTDFVDKDGTPYKALVNMETGEQMKRLDDPGSRARAQAETIRLRILNSAKSQPAIVGYVNVKNNYDSLAQNAAIPPEQRTGADDAAAIQAFGAIEHPGTGVTDADKKQAAGLVPLWDSLLMKGRNFFQNKSNALTADVVNQMRDAAKRALDGRQRVYNEEIAPLLTEAQRVGLKPEEVNGALGANVAEIKPPETKQDSNSVVTSQEQYEALPSGSIYADKDGGLHRKP